jgi:hypothetical protein
MWHARFVGERLSRAIGKPVETRLLGAPSRRDADEVDLQLAERWRRDGRFKEAPLLPAGTGLAVEHRNEASDLTMPVEPVPRLIIASVATLIVAALVFFSFRVDAAAFLFMWIVAGAISCFAFGFIARHSGRSRLRFTPGAVEFRIGRFPLVQRIALAEVEELIVSSDAFVLMGDRGYIRIDRPKEPADREAQRQFIDRQISRRQPAAG